MINFRQQELIEILTDRIREKFREVGLINVSESREYPETLRIRVTAPEDADRICRRSYNGYSDGLRLLYAGYADAEGSCPLIMLK